MNSSFDKGSGEEIRQVDDVFPGQRRRQIFPGVAARLGERVQNIPHRRFAGGQFPGQHRSVHCFQRGLQLRQAGAFRQIRFAKPQPGQKCFCQRVGFGVDRRVVQRVRRRRDSQKPGALRERGRPEPGDFQQFLAPGKTAVGIPPSDDVFGDGALNAGDMAQ